MVEVMKIVGTSFKRSCACTASLSTPYPATGHRGPCRSVSSAGDSWTHEKVWVRLLWVTVPFSWVLVNTRFAVPSKVLFPSPV